MMYRKLLEQMKAEIAASASTPQKKGDGFISRPAAAPKEDKSDPLALSREWIATIKASGEYFRNEIKPKKIEEIKKNEEEQVKVEVEAPIETPKTDPITNRPSIFDGMGSIEEGGNFSLDSGTPAAWDGDENEVTSLVRQAAQKYGMPEDIVLRLARQESGFKQSAKSSAGAIGVMQLMPGTAQGLGVDPYDLHQNIDGGVRYLKEQYDNFGSWDKALAGYNAGPGAVQKYNGVPPYAETQNYVRSILSGG